MEPKNFFVTGPPRSGKTTLIFQVINELKTKNITIGGVYCPEIRRGGIRLGFKIIDLKTNEEGILAHKEIVPRGPKVGKYTVNLEDLDGIGTRAIKNVIEDETDVIVIDEVGTMELKSRNFEKAVLDALNSKKPVIGVLHRRTDHSLLKHIRRRQDTQIYYIDRNTSRAEKEKIKEEIIKRVIDLVNRNQRT